MFLKSLCHYGVFVFGLASGSLSTPASAGQTYDAVKAKGFRAVRGPIPAWAGFSFSDSQGKWTRARRRSLPGRSRVAIFGGRRGRPSSRRTTAAAALRGAAVGRSRRHHPQRHPDPAARHLARLQHRRRLNFYDGPGPSSCRPRAASKSAKELAGATILRAARHDDRAQPCRLFPQEQDELQAGADREARRACCRLMRPVAAIPTRPMRRASPRCAPRPASRQGRSIRFLPERISKEPLGPHRAPRATISGSTS